jgi:hypothetical protein
LLAREDFTYFCTAMGKPPARHMLEWHRRLLTGQSNDALMDVAGPPSLILSPRGPLDLNTRVLGPLGWTELRNVHIGATVYDSYGQPTKVVDVMRYGRADCWEVELSDGTTITCDDSHAWLVRATTRSQAPWRKLSLFELRAMVSTRGEDANGKRIWFTREARPDEKPWLTPRGRHRWAVPVSEPVALPGVTMPLDPYLMGVLMARGTLSGSAVRLTLEDADAVERLRQSLPLGCQMRRVCANTTVWSISGDGSKPPGVRWMPSRNPILPVLDALGVWGKRARERPFPRVYLRGSIAQRVAFLQGFSDAAGVTQVGGRVTYSVRSAAIAAGMLELVRSLGAVAIQESVVRAGRQDVSLLKVSFPTEIEPFHAAAKVERHRLRTKALRPGFLMRTIVDIRPAGKRDIGCIEVESPLHDFLVEGHAVSCNSAKSTEVGLLCAWLIGRHATAQRLLRILYVSFNVDVARNKSKGIKNTVESPEYQEIFPMVRLSKDRTSDELWAIDFEHAGIDVRGEDAFTVACAGLKGAITSKRSNLVVLDDLIKSTEAIKNPETRREMENNWSSVIQPTMFEGARAIALGTRFHFDDMFATTFTPEAGWDVMTQVALSYGDEGQPVSYWPEMWSVEFLLERQAQNRVNFAYQYQNQPVQSNELGMPLELFVKGQIPDTFDQIGVGIDLSSGLRERNDYTVFMLGGRLDDKAYIIDQRRIRCMGNIEKVEALCDLLFEWNLLIKDEADHYLPTRSDVTIWPEEVSYQKSFQGDFRRIVFDEWGLVNLRVSPVRGVRGDKLARFRGVMGLFETGRVVFNKYRDFRVTFDEIMNLGHSPHDDCADALQILLERLFLRGRLEME